MDVAIAIFAGLGFIFIGTQYLTANMKQVAGPGMNRLAAHALGHPVRAAGTGVLAGGLIQSTNAVTFIVVGLVGAGAATVREAMPIVTWSYVGSTLRLLLASLDLKSAIMVVIGGVGLAFLLGYDRAARYRAAVGALLGLALLLFGVQVIVEGVAPLRQSSALRDALAAADMFYLWGFFAGTALASVVQGQTVSVIVVALAQGGLLGLDQSILIVIGANLGTGVQAIIQGSGLRGTDRQLNLYQLALKLIGVATLLPLMLLEHYAGLPTLAALCAWVVDDIALQVTASHWIFQIVAAVVATVFCGPLLRLVERASPPTQSEALAKPAHLDRRALGQPETALDLAAREQLRLLRRLPDFLAPLRDDPAAPPPLASPDVLRDAGAELARAIDRYLKSLLENPMPPTQLDRLMKQWSGAEVLTALHDALADLSRALAAAGQTDEANRLRAAMAESLHALLLVLIDEAEGGDVYEAGAVERLTTDRSAVMRRIREQLSEAPAALTLAERQAVWRATDLFERINWLLRRYAVNLSGNIAV